MAGDLVQVNDDDEIQIGSTFDPATGDLADGVVIAGETDPCCCAAPDPGDPYYCCRSLRGQYVCQEDGSATFVVTAPFGWYSWNEEIPAAEQAWHAIDASKDPVSGATRLCPIVQRTQVVLVTPPDPCPPEPEPEMGTPDAELLVPALCKWCIDISTAQVSNSYSLTVDGAACTSTGSGAGAPYVFHTSWLACSHSDSLPTDWIAISPASYLQTGGASVPAADRPVPIMVNHRVLYYQAGTETFRLVLQNTGVEGASYTSITTSANGSVTAGGVGNNSYEVTFEFTVDDLPVTLSLAATEQKSGTYAGGDCGDIGDPQVESWSQEIEIVFEVCPPVSKRCYYTKSAVRTEVSPGTWVWIPGSVTAQCLETAPGTLDAWACTGTNTAEIIREGDSCTVDGECTDITTEVPDGSFLCP